jgi:hypothetical protein
MLTKYIRYKINYSVKYYLKIFNAIHTLWRMKIITQTMC